MAKRKQVKNACVNCQRACKKCDDCRPCTRCVKYGTGDSCVDSSRKERRRGAKRSSYPPRPGTSRSTDGEDLSPTSSSSPYQQHLWSSQNDHSPSQDDAWGHLDARYRPLRKARKPVNYREPDREDEEDGSDEEDEEDGSDDTEDSEDEDEDDDNNGKDDETENQNKNENENGNSQREKRGPGLPRGRNQSRNRDRNRGRGRDHGFSHGQESLSDGDARPRTPVVHTALFKLVLAYMHGDFEEHCDQPKLFDLAAVCAEMMDAEFPKGPKADPGRFFTIPAPSPSPAPDTPVQMHIHRDVPTPPDTPDMVKTYRADLLELHSPIPIAVAKNTHPFGTSFSRVDF